MKPIVHLDADAFFASVEQASDVRLRGKPMAVGGEKRGIIASASYEARKYGIYTPMPTVRARKLCPKLILVPGDFEKYERFSKWMFSYAYDFTSEVEVNSIDEGYFDLSGVRNSPIIVADKIRCAIRDSLKISVSEGIGSNKLISQIASKYKKPSGFLSIAPGDECSFIHPLKNHWLPGIGPKTAERFDMAGLAYIGQIAKAPLELLSMLAGSGAEQLRYHAMGKDDRPIVTTKEDAKSYGQQETFEADTIDEEWIECVLRKMADELMIKVRADAKAVRTVTVKVRYNDMAEDQRSESLLEPTDLETDIYGRLKSLLKQAWKRRVSLRLVSLRFTNIYDRYWSPELPMGDELMRQKNHQVAEILDELRGTLGRYAIMRGHDLVLRERSEAVYSTAKPNGKTEKKTTVDTTGAGRKVYRREPRDLFTLRKDDSKDEIQLKLKAVSDRPPARSSKVRTYVPLNVHSYYSFLNSTLAPEKIVELAKKQGMGAIALTDPNLHGAVKFCQAAETNGIKPVMGAELMIDGTRLCLYVENEKGYRNLCRIVTNLGSGDSPNRQWAIGTIAPTSENSSVAIRRIPATVQNVDGLIAVSTDPAFESLFPGRFYLGVRNKKDFEKFKQTSSLPMVPFLPVHYGAKEASAMYEVIQSIRTLTLLHEAHPEKQNGDFHLSTSDELQEIFQGCDIDRLFSNSLEIADRCSFKFNHQAPKFPRYQVAGQPDPYALLKDLVWKGMNERYADSAEIKAQLDQELRIIHQVGYEEYFLVMWDILQECKRQNIPWLTRGSAADSLVCYCLGISTVCPKRFRLDFRRFLNKERMSLNKLPDIDVDFPHDRKDDVVDLIFQKYGEERVAIVGGFSTYRTRSAFADVAKVYGLSEYQVRRFTERLPDIWYGTSSARTKISEIPECRDLPWKEEPYATALNIAQGIAGFPRHPKMHPCGLVVSRGPMLDEVPCFISEKGYPTTHFDMEDVETIGLVKMDILAQGGLAVIRDVESELAKIGVRIPWSEINTWNDSEVWKMIASGNARAVHHIESPAMVSLCRMCQVNEIDGLVAIVSVIRPGAANEQKKMNFVRRYQGLEPTTYPHPSLETCLEDTYGMVVYEEHILQVCEAFAGFPAGKADLLRRALAKEKKEVIQSLGAELVESARRLGRSDQDIEKVCNLLFSFSGYAFCKAHSAAYGVEAYESAWLKRYYPVDFMAAVLSNGKGFYKPMVYILECHRLGIGLLPPSVNEPGPRFTVVRNENLTLSFSSPCQGNGKIRIPVSYIKGMTNGTCARMISERGHRDFASLKDFVLRVHPSPEEMQLLLKVGALDEFGSSRTKLFWEIQLLFRESTAEGQDWLLPPASMDKIADLSLTESDCMGRLKVEDELLGFPVSRHPLELYSNIDWDSYCKVSDLVNHMDEVVTCCGLIIEDRLHSTLTGELMKFLTLADWTGMVETELFAPTYRSYGLATVRYPVLEVTAKVEPYDNRKGYSLRILRAGAPRVKA